MAIRKRKGSTSEAGRAGESMSEISEVSEMSASDVEVKKPTILLVNQAGKSRWESWWRRFWWSWVMVLGFLFIVFYTGQFVLICNLC